MTQDANKIVSEDDFRELTTSLGFAVRGQDEADYLTLLRSVVSAVDKVDKMEPYQHPLLQHSKDVGPRSYTTPKPDENPLNAWSHRTVIKPTGEGLLSGKTIAIKDNISVAGLPLTGGTQAFHLSKDKPYPISTFDAPVVSRVLAAGATIIGTSTCENYCMSAQSFTSATGPVHNPWHKGYNCGGSSSGSGALVAIQTCKARHHNNNQYLGDGADLALGADQGGSIRMPAAYSGIYGLKPTHGLVPYTGLTPLFPAIDHCGPMASSLRDTALLLTAIAGYDGLDPRMTPETPLRAAVPQYHALLDDAIAARKASGCWTPTTAAAGLRIGIIREAWAAPQLSDEVARVVKAAAQRFAALGAAAVEEVSIPLHAEGGAIFAAVVRAGMADVFVHGKPPEELSWPLLGLGGSPDAKWFETMSASAPTVVSAVLVSAYLNSPAGKERFPLADRARAVVQAHALRAAYDEALGRFDVLVTPANPTVAPRHPDATMGVLDKYELALGNTWNTCNFNLTGHPALVLPVGWGAAAASAGGGDEEVRLPIGMQLVAKRWDESMLFLAASAWEAAGLGLDM